MKTVHLEDDLTRFAVLLNQYKSGQMTSKEYWKAYDAMKREVGHVRMNEAQDVYERENGGWL